MKELINKKVSKVFLNEDKTYITFECDDGSRLTWYAYGDCCSNSWIEHIDGIHNILNSTIESIEEIDGQVIDNHPDHDYLSIYFYKFKTSSGYAQIDMRNSSNGYYGGNLEFVTDNVAGEELKKDF